MQTIFQALVTALRSGEEAALGIITGVKGSSPQKVGAKAVFYPDGRIAGTLGGGCLEAEIQQRALHALRSGKPARFELLLDHDFGWDDGLVCGGKVFGVILPRAESKCGGLWSQLSERRHSLTWGVTPDFAIERIAAHESFTRRAGVNAARWLYHETVNPPCPLWIAGAGHVAQAVAPLALQVDFAVTVFDDRPALASHRIFPAEVALRVGDWEELPRDRLPPVPGFGLIVTRGHRHDALVLRHWIHQPFAFLGMIGSRRKARMIAERFIEEQIASSEELERLVCPVGVPIRSQSVAEIAVSIVAQLIEKRAELFAGETSHVGSNVPGV